MDEIIVIAGPTGVGKSDLAVELAKRIDAEIVSADSVQIYKGMNIGSAKISMEERCGIPHHMIDVLDIGEECDVLKFRDMARSKIDEIGSKGKAVIVAGGTGFYIQAILRDVRFAEDAVDKRFREELLMISKRDGGAAKLYERLFKEDPKSAKEIEPNNVKRVIRALEFFKTTGQSLSEHNQKERQKKDFYRHRIFVLNDDRERLYQRIDDRVDRMIASGLEEEVRGLYHGCSESRILNHAIGYREILGCLRREYDMEEAIRLIKRNTRHFAKRQLTYFRIQTEAEFLDIQEGTEEMLQRIMNKETEERAGF